MRGKLSLMVVMLLIIVLAQTIQGVAATPGYEVLYREYKGFYTGDNWAIVVLGDALKIYSTEGNYSVKNPFNPSLSYYFIPSAKLVVAIKPGGLVSLPKLGVMSVNGTILREIGSVSSMYISGDKLYYTFKKSSGKGFGKYLLYLKILPDNKTLNLTSLALKYNETGFQVTPAEDERHVCLMGISSHTLVLMDTVTGEYKDYGRGWSHVMYPYLDGCLLLPKLGNNTVWFVNWSKKLGYNLLAGKHEASVIVYIRYYTRMGEQAVVPYEIRRSENPAVPGVNNSLGVLVWNPKENKTFIYEIPGKPEITQLFSGKTVSPLAASEWGIAVAVNKYKHAKPDSNSQVVNAWTELHLVSTSGVKHVFKLPLMEVKSLAWVDSRLYYSFSSSTSGNKVTGVIDAETGKILRKINSGGLYLVPLRVGEQVVIVALPADWGKITVYDENLNAVKTLGTGMVINKYAVIGETIIASAETDEGNIILALNPAKIIETTTTTQSTTATQPTTSPTSPPQTTTKQTPTSTTTTTTTTTPTETSSPTTPTTSSIQQGAETTSTPSSPQTQTMSSNTLIVVGVVVVVIVAAIAVFFLKSRK